MKFIKRTLVVGVLIALLAPMVITPKSASALFDSSRLIDDTAFNNTDTMDAASIDEFLNRYSSCVSTGSGFSAIDPVGYSPSAGFLYGGNVSAGTVIYHAAQAYDINPQVLLTTLQKEQSLVTTKVTDSNCNTRVISKAMGYACTDSYSPHSYSDVNLYTRNGTTYTSVDLTCVESKKKVGFTQQIIRAAWLLKFTQQRSLGNIGWAVVEGNWDNSDDPNSCYSGAVTQGWRQVCPSGPTTYYDGYTTIDGQSVYLSSGATTALYRYTPHFSGNQNFVKIWTEWFGSTMYSFTPVVTPRWMRISSDTAYKKDIITDQETEGPFTKGTTLFFASKITLGGKTYLRTRHDTNGNQSQGILIDQVEDIPYDTMLYPRWMELAEDTYKQIPRQGTNVDGLLHKGQTIYFTSKTVIDGKIYLRTQHDTGPDNDKGIDMSKLKDASFQPMVVPRRMTTGTATTIQKVNPFTGKPTGETLTPGQQIAFASKITLGDQIYLRTQLDTDSDTSAGFLLKDLTDITFEPMVNPRIMVVATPTYKYNTDSLAQAIGPYAFNTKIKFTSKITIDGKVYLRSEVDTRDGQHFAIPITDLKDL